MKDKHNTEDKQEKESDDKACDIVELALIAFGSIAIVASIVQFALAYPKLGTMCFFLVWLFLCYL